MHEAAGYVNVSARARAARAQCGAAREPNDGYRKRTSHELYPSLAASASSGRLELMETLFGPDSAVWVLHGDAAGLVGGVRALAVQALEPRALAGVEQFSAFAAHPDQRLAETIDFMDIVTYGSLDEVEAAVAAVRRLHEPVVGTDPVSGLPFDANDPALLAFVHNSLVASVGLAYASFHPGLDATILDRYASEMTRFAALMGADLDLVPERWAACVRVVDTWSTLTVSDAYRRALEVLEGLRVDGPIALVWPALIHWVRQSLPSWVKAELGVAPNPVADLGAWIALWTAGVLGSVLVPPSPRRLKALGEGAR